MVRDVFVVIALTIVILTLMLCGAVVQKKYNTPSCVNTVQENE